MMNHEDKDSLKILAVIVIVIVTGIVIVMLGLYRWTVTSCIHNEIIIYKITITSEDDFNLPKNK